MAIETTNKNVAPIAGLMRFMRWSDFKRESSLEDAGAILRGVCFLSMSIDACFSDRHLDSPFDLILGLLHKAPICAV